jgi:hypothetical protein
MPRLSLVSVIRLLIAGGLALGVLGGCSLEPKPAPGSSAAVTAPTRPIRIGEVKVIDERKRFVLIDLQANLYLPQPGVMLRAMRDSAETARLKVSPERKRPFIAADIIEGDPAVGDEVLQ